MLPTLAAALPAGTVDGEEDWVGRVREQGRALASEMAALKQEAREKAAKLAASGSLALLLLSFCPLSALQ